MGPSRQDADYVRSWTVALPDAAPTQDAESWARDVLARAPRPLGELLRVGWRLGLRFALGPRSSPEHVLGWDVVRATPDAVTLREQSAVMTAENRLDVRGRTITWTTTIWFGNRVGKPLWAAASPIHSVTIRYLLRRARARKAGNGSSGGPSSRH